MSRVILFVLLVLSLAACESSSSEPPKLDNNNKPLPTSESLTTGIAQPTLPIAIPTQDSERPDPLTPSGQRPTFAPNQPTPSGSRTIVPGNLPTVNPTIPPLPTMNATLVPNYDAAQVITTFAKTMLGKDVTVIRASGASGNLVLPPSVESQVSMALKLAGAVYVGAISNGGAEVALGSGSISGDMNVDIQSASLGVYSLVSNEPAPKDAATALSLVKATYPGVAGFNYTQQNSQAGFSWYAVTTHAGVDARTRLVITVAEAVMLGVTPSGARSSLIWVVVGNGSFASTLKPQ